MPILTAILLTSAVAATTPPAACPRPEAHHVDRAPAQPAGPQRLGEMPPADRIAAVARYDDKGCLRPVVLRRGVGSAPTPR